MNDRSYKDAKTIKSSYLSGCTFIMSTVLHGKYTVLSQKFHVPTQKKNNNNNELLLR